jgi:hypothetical protein
VEKSQAEEVITPSSSVGSGAFVRSSRAGPALRIKAATERHEGDRRWMRTVTGELYSLD